MFRTLLKQVGKYKKDAILTPVFVILEVVMEVLIPLMMAAIIDYGLERQDIKMVCLLGAVMVIMAMLALFFGVWSGKLASSASSGFAMNLRQAMYEKIQTFSFSNIDKFSTAGLVTRMTTDVMNVQQAFQMSIRICVRAPIMLAQCNGNDIYDTSTVCHDLSGGDCLSGSSPCPDLIKSKSDFEKGLSRI